MKAITLHQPWASLIACGHKTVETRSWAPPGELIGERIAIHAGKQGTSIEMLLDIAECCAHMPCEPVPFGAVVATARLADAGQVLSYEEADAFVVRRLHGGRTYGRPECVCGDYREGRWLWVLENIEALDPPVPARGYQGLWEWTP